jgi:hypothetical protein
VFDGIKLRAETRKGSRLEVSPKVERLLELLDAVRYNDQCSMEEAMEKLIKDKQDLSTYSSDT